MNNSNYQLCLITDQLYCFSQNREAMMIEKVMFMRTENNTMEDR